MRRPRIGEANLGAIIAAAVGSVGGLFAVGLAPAILEHNFQNLFIMRNLALMGFAISGPTGWMIGGQLAPRLEPRFSEQTAAVVGGVIGGLIPVGSIAIWSWYMVTR